MTNTVFQQRYLDLKNAHQELIHRKNVKIEPGNGIYERYQYPMLTSDHIPLDWRYDLNPTTNPYLQERLGIGAVFNAGAIKLNGKYLVAARIEGVDRKSFFGVAESDNGIDNFRFWEYPLVMPETSNPDINVYDLRLTQHEDGWIYGVFCTERKDPNSDRFDTSSAVASAGIARTKNLVEWQRLPDMVSRSNQQRNVVLHPEFIQGQYAFYTRPQDGFIETGTGGGIAWGVCKDIENPVIDHEEIIDARVYHTIKEVKNGQVLLPSKPLKGGYI